MTRVSVIIPCHNDGAVVVEAVASVREEEPVEIVVIDDGSTHPATLEELSRLAARGTRVVRQENTGLGGARMAGLAATTAPFVWPLDADDLAEPGALAAMADTLEQNPDAGFTWGDYATFGNSAGRYRSPATFLPWTVTYVNAYPVSSMFRRDVLGQAGGWEGWAYEDWGLWIRLAGLGVSGVKTDRVVYRRRLHGTSRLLAQARRRHQELFAQIEQAHADVFARRPELRRKERPALWKRVVYPVVFGPRNVVPVPVEAFLVRVMLRLGIGLPGTSRPRDESGR